MPSNNKSGKNETKRTVTGRQPRTITIVKHFDHKLLHNNNYCELPEVDNVEEIENKSVGRKKFIKRQTIKNKHAGLNDMKIIAPGKQKEFPKKRRFIKNTISKSSLTSSSSNRDATVTEKPKQSMQRSKSFSAPGKKTQKTFPTPKVSNIFSTSGSILPENSIEALKQEILTNRSDNSAIPDAKKLRERQQRVDSLRKEIGKFIEVNLTEKSRDIAGLKSEICNFRVNRNYQVCHVREVTERSDDGPDEETEKNVGDDIDRETNAEEEEIAEKPSGSTTAPGDTSETDDRPPPKQLEPQHTAPQDLRIQESIKVKIRKANMLIDRVKEALEGIKFKDKGSSSSCLCTDQEQSSQPNTATTDSDKENDCCFIIQQSKAKLEAQMRAMEMGTGTPSINLISVKTAPEASRPKTRRCECSEDDHDVEERYRTSPGCRAPPVSCSSPPGSSDETTRDTLQHRSLQLLREKLNAISEHATETTESESEKPPAVCVAACNTVDIETTTSATNTEPPCTMSSKESQYSPCGSQKGTQSYIPAAEKSLQTDQKTKAPLTTVTVENAVIPPKSCQVKNLVIQSLPPIDVKISQPRMQSLLHYSIENNQTKLIFKNDTCNVAFQLTKSQDLTDEQEPPPVKPEPSANLLKIVEKGNKTRESVELATPRVAKKILELEYPDTEVITAEDEEDEDESNNTSEPDTDSQSPPVQVPPVALDMNIALKITDTKRSISEVLEDKDEACLFTNKLPEKKSLSVTVADEEFPPDREKVLQSYHVYDNVNAHDPGMLNSSSLDFVAKVDENVYKTYINPSGFQKPLASDKSNINRSSSMRKCGLSLLSTLKIIKSQSGEDAKCSTPQEAVPKIWSLGFYANKSTQVLNETPSEPEMERSSRGEVQQEEQPPAGEERALKVISFTHSASRFQLTNKEEDRPAQLQAERDEDPAYQPISCDGRCNQWAADLRTVITSIRTAKEEPEAEKNIAEEPTTQDIRKQTRSTGCSCSLLTSKADVHVSQNITETQPLKQEDIAREMGSPKLSSGGQPSSKEQTSNKNSETTKKPDEPEGNKDDNRGTSSDRTEKHQSVSPKPSEKLEDGSQPTLVEYRTMNGSHLETISLTVSYTTGDSMEVNSPDMQTRTSCTRDSNRLSGLSNTQKTKFQLNNPITEEGKVKLRAIKDKLGLEHGEQSKTNIATETIQSRDKIGVCEEVSNFISGLTQHPSDEIKKVIPIIRSRKSLSKQEKSKSTRTFDVNYVFGDFRQPKVTELLARKSSKQNKDHLKVASNGRCKEEAKPFSRFNVGLGSPKTPPTKQAAQEKPEPQVVRRPAKHSGHHKHKHKHNFKVETPSNSETITTERSKSEGELTSCQCVVSNGELHSCRYDQFHRMNPPMFNDAEDLVTTIRKKRSYFNNCVTYYLKRTPVPGPPYSSNRSSQQQVINNSSISSNTAT